MNKVILRPQITSPTYLRQQVYDVVGQIEDQINRGADGFLFPVKRVTTTPYAMTTNDSIVLVDATASSIVINLKPALEWEGKRMTIKKIDASANTVTITAFAGETIDGAATKVISAQYISHDLASQGGGVWII